MLVLHKSSPLKLLQQRPQRCEQRAFKLCLNVLTIKSRLSLICQTLDWFCYINPCGSGIPHPVLSPDQPPTHPSTLEPFSFFCFFVFFLQSVVASTLENPADLHSAGVFCLLQPELFALRCQCWIQAAFAHRHSDPNLHGNSFTIF